MASPEIKVIAVSNVFCRLMNFVKAGDVEHGHKHHYDHATLVSNGSVIFELLDDEDQIISSREFIAPNMVFVSKDHKHRLIATSDNTVCSCIHALRDIEDEIIDPDFLITPFNSSSKSELIDFVFNTHEKGMSTLAIRNNE
jgi:hypothetical protein